jgi:NADH-quinone oxidoreductase subunit G
VDSELSGNMIDICPVGALTSKPFRYSARTWELSRRKSVSPHDSTGANLIVQVKNNKVMRVVPLENEDVNECWIADRDRFSYEALNGDDRLTEPHAQAGRPVEDRRLADRAGICGQRPQADQGRPRRCEHWRLVSPHSTLEELYLAGQLMRGLGMKTLTIACATQSFRLQKVCVTLVHRSRRCHNLQRVLVVGRICARITRCLHNESGRQPASAVR